MEEKYFFDNDNDYDENRFPIYNYNNTGDIMIVNPFFYRF